MRALAGPDLVSCPPAAFVETLEGTTRYPLQLHLHGLGRERAKRCVEGLARARAAEPRTPAHFEEMLRFAFGDPMCEAFLLPYNRKVYKHPLDQLATAGFQWTITPPDFDEVVRGASSGDVARRAYNSRGFYPRPPRGSPCRGMEVLTRSLAARANVRLGHRVEAIDLTRRVVVAVHDGQRRAFRYRRACSTLPMPRTVALCSDLSGSLSRDVAALPHVRVVSVALSVRGPRPAGRGHWRYYADESLVFTRLVHMHEFDPDSAPEECWGLLVEVTERAEGPLQHESVLLRRVERDVRRVGALCGGEILDANVMVANPAYVLFTQERAEVVRRVREALGDHLSLLGRYGRWEYSSMAQVIRDGLAWGAEAVASTCGSSPDEGECSLS